MHRRRSAKIKARMHGQKLQQHIGLMRRIIHILTMFITCTVNVLYLLGSVWADVGLFMFLQYGAHRKVHLAGE